MALSEVPLKRCLRQLILQGRKHGGYVTYQGISDTLQDKQCNVSMEAIDFLYVRLTAAGIQIVDQLPVSSIKGESDEHSGLDREHHWKYKRSARPIRWKRRHDHSFRSEQELHSDEVTSSSEDAIDALLLRWETTGELSNGDFLAAIESSGLSSIEVAQLIDYLGSKGVDVPRAVLRKFYEADLEDDMNACAKEEPNSKFRGFKRG